MSYIDIKTEKADFRIILTSHSYSTNICQLPDNCTGVLLETNFVETDEELPYLFVENSPVIDWKTRRQYGGIIEEAKKRKISIATALSPVVEGRVDKRNKLLGKYTGPYLAAEELAASAYEFKEDHPLVEALKREIENNLALNPLSPIPYMDVMMAQSVLSIARVQIDAGVDPFLSIVMGAFHIGTIKGLGMTEEERVKILSGKLNRKIYSKGKLGNVYYTEYDPTQEKYVRKLLEGRFASI